MADMLPEIKNHFVTNPQNAANLDQENLAIALGKLLEEHKGQELIVIDLRPMFTWTDFFVIATVSSSTHLEGLERHIKNFIREQELEIFRRSSKTASLDDEWRILDMGTIVVHLMSGRTRSFYELERLYQPPLAKIIYSSKS